MDRDVNKPRISFTKWDPEEGPHKIEELIKKAQHRVVWYMEWYQQEKKSKRRGSKSIRLICIVLFILTTLIPLVNSLLLIFLHKNKEIVDSGWLLNIGYIIALIATGLFLLDRFYGFSTGWIRLNSTLTELGNARREFENILLNARLIHAADNLDGFKALVSIIKTFDDNISAIVKAETDTWVKEFQAGNEELQTLLKTQSEQQKPGDLKVSVKNYTQFEDITLNINGSDKGKVYGGIQLITSIRPGNHAIKITAIKVADQKQFVKTDVAVVKPGEMCTLEIVLE
jgi:hypothetical protein